LAHALCARRLHFGFDTVELAPYAAQPATFGAMVSLKEYPFRTLPGILDGALRLPFEMALTESFAFVDHQASLNRMNLALRRLRAADDDAISLRRELVAAKDDVAAGRAAYGEHHLSILVKASSLDDLDSAVADVQSALAETGSIAVREDVNLEPAFWAQFPGNLEFVARKALISTANFSSLASFHNHPTGHAHGTHWGGPITVLETTAFGPYSFNFHSCDLGNFTVIGPSGSGKTALLAFLLAQAERLEPRIAYFDKDRGAESFIRALNGRYDVIAPGEPTGFNPLTLPDSGETRAFLSDWIANFCRMAAAPSRSRIVPLSQMRSMRISRKPLRTAVCASCASCSAASGVRARTIWPRGLLPGVRAASTPGCSTTPSTGSIYQTALSALT
jgi:type IV secretion system protein VirB4